MIRRAERADVAHVWVNMRDEDRTEINAAVGHSHFELHGLALRSNAICYVATKKMAATMNVLPAVIYGAVDEGHGTATLFRFGTRNWPDVVREVIRHARRQFIPELRRRGVKRLEANTLDIPEATAWLRLFGAKKERVYGKNGRDFAVFGLDLTA